MREIVQSYVVRPALGARRALVAVALGTAVVAGGLHTMQVHAQAQPQAQTQTPAIALPDFTSIVEKAEPAVVNIRTTATVSSRGERGGQDPYEMFRHFFGPDAVPPGAGKQAPGPRGGKRGGSEPEEHTVPRGVGSGFIISTDGSVLTNHHVVADATEIFVTLSDGREFKAKVVGSDERTDVALVKIDAKDLTALPIGDPKQLKKGQWVLAIGSPFGLESTVTSGIVSALGRDTGDYLPFIQTDVAVNPGNSGGPLLNLKGEVVGINSQIVSHSGGYMGISLSIPINEAMKVVEQLKVSGKVSRGRIGVQIGEVSKEVAEAIGLPKAEGALVSGVEADSPADKAGIQPGDVITKFGDKRIGKWTDLPRVVGETKPGATVPMEVWRKGKSVKLSAKVGEMKADEKVASAKSDAKADKAATTVLGMEVVAVDADTLKELKIKGGVQVESVEGAASNAGIAEGDIIMVVNDTDVTSPEQFAKVVGGLDKSRPVGLMIRRGEQTQWVAVKPAK